MAFAVCFFQKTLIPKDAANLNTDNNIEMYQNPHFFPKWQIWFVIYVYFHVNCHFFFPLLCNSFLFSGLLFSSPPLPVCALCNHGGFNCIETSCQAELLIAIYRVPAVLLWVLMNEWEAMRANELLRAYRASNSGRVFCWGSCCSRQRASERLAACLPLLNEVQRNSYQIECLPCLQDLLQRRLCTAIHLSCPRSFTIRFTGLQ